MNKKEVAEYLGISTRQVETYASKGQLGEVSYVRGRTGKQADYALEAVEKLKSMLESPDTAVATKSPDARLFVAQLVEALTTREEANVEAIRGSLSVSIDRISERIESVFQQQAEASDRAQKLMLTIAEAATLTGLPKSYVRQSVKDGKLKAIVIGRIYRIKRQDLDSFVNDL